MSKYVVEMKQWLRPWVEAYITQPCFLPSNAYIVFLETMCQDDPIMTQFHIFLIHGYDRNTSLLRNHSDIAMGMLDSRHDFRF